MTTSKAKSGPTVLPAALNVTGPVVNQIFDAVQANMLPLLRIDDIRHLVTQYRWAEFQRQGGQLAVIDSGDMIGSTVEHNMRALDTASAIGRSILLLGPLLGVTAVVHRMREMKVLVLGPRTESELLLFAAYGFPLTNIRGLDLMSYSPFVDVGDMHDMPYPDQSYDVVFASCVLAYSNNRPKAAAEIKRVLRPGGFVCVAEEYDPKPVGATSAALEQERGYRLDSTHAKTTGALIDLFGTRTADVIFQTEPVGSERDQPSRLAVILRV